MKNVANVEKEKTKMKKKIIGALLVTQLFSATVSAKEIPQGIPDDRAIKSIIGEGENQGEKGMFALACAIRNRGTLKGVYGYHAITEINGQFIRITKKGTRKISKKIVDQATAAWKKSAIKRIHSGDHWENVKAFGVPEWSRGMERVYEIGDHVFFKSMSKMSKGTV